MAKFSRIPKLNKKERQDLLISLCEALATVKKRDEAAQFLTDLLSPQELEMLSKRLAIAKYLIHGKTYGFISEILKVSHNTIARVNAWLTLSGNGFRLVIERTKNVSKEDLGKEFEEKYDPYSWHNTKRRYSMYFWPEILIDEIIKRSNKKDKQKLYSILSSIEGKQDVLKEVDREYREFRKSRRKTNLKNKTLLK